MNLEEKFNRVHDEFLKFDRVEVKLHTRPDLCAFLLLDQLVHGNSDIVAAAEHDEIYLDTDLDELEKVATLEDVLTLTRCGVIYNSEGLSMYA